MRIRLIRLYAYYCLDNHIVNQFDKRTNKLFCLFVRWVWVPPVASPKPRKRSLLMPGSEIEQLLPPKTPSRVKKNPNLLFSLFTGFNQWVVPNKAASFEIPGFRKSGFCGWYRATTLQFAKKISNNRSVADQPGAINSRRDLFYDKSSKTRPFRRRSHRQAKVLREPDEFGKKRRGIMELHGES